jgi:hypothetical protein
MKTKTTKNPGLIYAKALDHHNEIEQRLARVMNQWQKSRAALRRLEKRLDNEAMDKAQTERWEADQAFIDDAI